MPSPLVHTGVALGLWLGLGLHGWRSALAVIVAASAPDVDLVYRCFGPEYMRFHHGATHSWLGAAILGLGSARLAVRLGGAQPWRFGLACVLAGVSHVPLDYSTGGPNPPKSFGVAAFWPWSDERFIDSDPFFGAFGLHRDGFLLNLLTAEALPLYGREAAVALAAVGLGALVRASTRRIRSRAP